MEYSHHVFTSAGVQQQHIEHYDVYALFFCENAPLLQNLPIIPVQTVNALDVEQIIFLCAAKAVCTMGGRTSCQTICPYRCFSPEYSAHGTRQAAHPRSAPWRHPDITINCDITAFFSRLDPYKVMAQRVGKSQGGVVRGKTSFNFLDCPSMSCRLLA